MKLRQNVFISKSEEQTRAFAREFAESLTKGGVIALYGDLGAGKTTFAQGLAEGLGIERRIISPTFVIVRTYDINNKRHETRDKKKYSSSDQAKPKSREVQKDSSRQARTVKTLYHIDLYRLEKRKQIEELGLKELMENSENLIVIEWAEKMKEYLPKERFDIYIQEKGENKRKIRVNQVT